MTKYHNPVPVTPGEIELIQTKDVHSPRFDCYLLVELPQDEPKDRMTLLGYLRVENPDHPSTTSRYEQREDQKPTDRRIEDVWLHPARRGNNLGITMGKAAFAAELFQSHSVTRSEAGDIWAKRVGGIVPATREVPDAHDLEAGCRRTYDELLRCNPGLQGLADS